MRVWIFHIKYGQQAPSRLFVRQITAIGLTTAGFYGPLGSGSHENRKDFVPNPINAVVVLQDPYKENNPNSKTLVILTNSPASKPLKVYDGYDARSEIENSLTTAYQVWMDQQDKLEHDGQDTGIRKFREKVKGENGNKLIIFDQDRYAIFEAYEVFILCDCVAEVCVLILGGLPLMCGVSLFSEIFRWG